MEERKFQVLEQTAPSRCEVCHQADQFDPFTATCMRCQALIIAQSLPSEQAQRYQEFQQVARPRDVNVPLGDLFKIMPEAFKLCVRNIGLLLKVCAVVQIPMIITMVWPYLLAYLDKSKGVALLGVGAILTILARIIFAPIMSGALTKTILDRYRGENVYIWDSYEFILEKGWRYILTSIFGGIYQYIGIVLFGVGMVYTYPRGMFVPEVSIVEDKYFGEALDRSKKLGSINAGIPIVLGLIWYFLEQTLTVFITITFSFLPILLGFMNVSYITSIIASVLSLTVCVFIMPFFFTTKLLLYFHLRMRSDDVQFIGDSHKKSIYPMPEN